MRLQSYLNFPGNAEAAFTFYRSVFGGELSALVRFRDVPIEGVEIPEEDLDKVMHVALPIGDDDVLMASDALASLGQHLVQGNDVYLSVHPDSRAEADRIFRALAEGGEVEMPIADQFWGDYYGSLRDRFGMRWMVSHSPAREG